MRRGSCRVGVGEQRGGLSGLGIVTRVAGDNGGLAVLDQLCRQRGGGLSWLDQRGWGRLLSHHLVHRYEM